MPRCAVKILTLLASAAVALQFPPDKAQMLLDLHNLYRGKWLPATYPSSNMIKLQWSDELVASAEKWTNHLAATNGCRMKHPGPETKYPYGQNLAWQKGYSYASFDTKMNGLIKQAMDGWGRDEMKYLIPKVEMERKNTQRFAYDFSTFDHYTQLVWAKTTHVGCAYAKCGDEYVTACEYSPPGNMRSNGVQQEWYLKGQSCSNCPNGYQRDADEKLCVAPEDSTASIPYTKFYANRAPQSYNAPRMTLKPQVAQKPQDAVPQKPQVTPKLQQDAVPKQPRVTPKSQDVTPKPLETSRNPSPTVTASTPNPTLEHKACT